MARASGRQPTVAKETARPLEGPSWNRPDRRRRAFAGDTACAPCPSFPAGWPNVRWMHPRDPKFAEKARLILDLYAGLWEGRPLSPHEQTISADEKTSIQARPAPVGSAWPVAWDVRRGISWGRCEPKTGVATFTRPVDQVVAVEPYRSAPRVFWIVDNGTSHQGKRSARRPQGRYPNLILIHTPTHASWPNQVEVLLSIVQRKVLTPAVTDSLGELEARILAFEAECRRYPWPVRCKFTRQEFDRRLLKLQHLTLQLAV